MRSLGYPPGWLEEARLEHSGISLYNSEGQIETDPSDELNELPDPENKDKYDVKKLHDFPGYNIPPPPGTHDYFWPPEQQIMHSKESMLESLKGRKTEDGYKRKKLKLSAPQSADSSMNSCIEPIEMEIESHDNNTPASPDDNNSLIDNNDYSSSSTNPETNDDNLLPPGVVETELIDEPKQINIETSDEQDVKVDKDIINNSMDMQDDIPSTPIINKSINIFDISGLDGSPSLTDLEYKKKLLLQELDDSSLQSNPATPVRLNLTNEFITPTTTTTVTPKCGSVKSVEFGTPIIQSTSRFTKLPSSDKFSKNICDVINFENLPDSTGKYEKITGLLQKVRDTLANIENND